MADEQQLQSCTPMLRDQMSGAFHGALIDPARGEAERVELRPQHVTNGADAGMIAGAAVDVDEALEQRDRGGRALIDRVRDATLGVGEAGLRAKG